MFYLKPGEFSLCPEDQIWPTEPWHLTCGASHRLGNFPTGNNGKQYSYPSPPLPNSQAPYGWIQARPCPFAPHGWIKARSRSHVCHDIAPTPHPCWAGLCQAPFLIRLDQSQAAPDSLHIAGWCPKVFLVF